MELRYYRSKEQFSICQFIQIAEIDETFVTLLELIEYLISTLCKYQKWKEQIKDSIFSKFKGLTLKTVTVVRFLKTKNTPKF